MNRLTLSVAEVAEALGVSRRTVYDMVADGRLRALNLGRRVVIPRVALEELLGHPIEVPS